MFVVHYGALQDRQGRYLSEKCRFCVIPSLTTLKLIHDSPADYHSQTGALIVGDPDFGRVKRLTPLLARGKLRSYWTSHHCWASKQRKKERCEGLQISLSGSQRCSWRRGKKRDRLCAQSIFFNKGIVNICNFNLSQFMAYYFLLIKSSANQE